MTTLDERTKLRTSQLRRLEHACEVLDELINKLMPSQDLKERELAEVYKLQSRLGILIQQQHLMLPREETTTQIVDGY